MRDFHDYIDPRDLGDDGATDDIGMMESDYIWLSDRMDSGNKHAENIFRALVRIKSRLALFDNYLAHSDNLRMAGLEPMLWREWVALDALGRERETLREARTDDVADLY